MGAPTDANKARLQELEKLSDSREQRLADLRQKTARSAEEEAEFKQWNALYETRMAELASLQADLQASRVAEYDKLSKLIAGNVTDAVKAVAEAQKLALVVRKERRHVRRR